jgi:hypothetical protein
VLIPKPVSTNTFFPTTDILPSIPPPAPTYQAVIPTLQPSTNTPAPSILYETNFENGVDTYWQVYGSWVVSNNQLVFTEGHKSQGSLFNERAGLVFPGTASLDNITIEFDAVSKITVLLSFKDEFNFKSILIDEAYSNSVRGFFFVSNENGIVIPQSEVYYPRTGYGNIHARIEIRNNSLVMNINEQQIYNLKNLPDVVTGPVGFIFDIGKPILLNFKIYNLP